MNLYQTHITAIVPFSQLYISLSYELILTKSYQLVASFKERGISISSQPQASKQQLSKTTLKMKRDAHVHYSIIQNSQDLKQLRCASTEKWLWYTYLYIHGAHKMVRYLLFKEKKILPFATTWATLRGHYAKWNKPNIGRDCLISLICGI